jgi:hypothetical protein
MNRTDPEKGGRPRPNGATADAAESTPPTLADRAPKSADSKPRRGLPLKGSPEAIDRQRRMTDVEVFRVAEVDGRKVLVIG